MNCSEYIIKYIKEIKENFNNNKYCSGNELEKAFNTINELTGINAEAVQDKNLNDIFAIQEFLINEVCKIHESENDLVNAELLSSNTLIIYLILPILE